MERSGYLNVMDDEYRARGIDVPVEDPTAMQRETDLKAVASTPEGRRVLGAVVGKYQNVGFAIEGGSALYAAGLRQPGTELEIELRRILPRGIYFEIMYPKEDSNA